ncbi:nicotinate-nucleotide adenylyltransferase [Caenispirillum salinarum]|uniref:nicotinate-nucleotide adenylyltransferase n=1 Tax=Caenispirillum salinarum TaxID=859058 RepID=UPI00384C21EE
MPAEVTCARPRGAADPRDPLPAYGDRRRVRVGLLGGSFNPAHDGHRYISLEALKRLDLDEVWWLVSPQNPLKSSRGMAPQTERADGARMVAAHPRIRVTTIESRLGTRYTADTLRVLRLRYPLARFVWIMGADNLVQIDRWRRWSSIFRTLPVAVFDRSPYSYQALASKAARRFARDRLPLRKAPVLAGTRAPAWVFLPIRRHPQSATAIRAGRHGAGGSPGGSRGATGHGAHRFANGAKP